MNEVGSAAVSALALFLDQTNAIVTSLTAFAILYTRSAGVAYFAVGATACAFSVKLVKRLIRQPRPVHVPGMKGRAKNTYGMPSTHSAVITHFAVYIPLACAFLPLHPSLPNSKWTRLLPSLIAVPWASAIVYSRMWLGHHTWLQCLAGCLYGTGFALIWFKLWTNGFNALGQSAEVAFRDALNR